MPYSIEISEDYIKSITGETNNSALKFDPRSANDVQFKEFMTFFFLNMTAQNKVLEGKIASQQEEIKQLRRDNKLLELNNNDAHLLRDAEVSDLHKENKQLKEDLSRLKEEVKSSAIKIRENYEKCIAQERYSRGFNLRFPGIPEVVGTRVERSKEDCIQKLKQKLQVVGLDNVQIENAHRTGKESADKPRAIIAKFYSRPERREILRKKKELFSAGIQVFEDLVKEDRDRKAKYAGEIKALYDSNKRVWFAGGWYYVDGVKQTQMI